MFHKWVDIKRPGDSNAWVKFFTDGEIETGYDEDVAKNLASWRKGRQKGMIGAALVIGSHFFYLGTEDGQPGDFWQSDDYEAIIGQPGKMVRRRIQVKMANKSWKTLEIDLKTLEEKMYVSQHKI